MGSFRLSRAAVGASAIALVAAGAVAVFGATAPREVEVRPEVYARTLMAAGDYRLAAETLRAAYRADPSQALKVELSRALLSVGDFAAALEILSDGAPASAGDQSYLRAEAMIRAERYADAGAVASSILAQHDGDGAALLLTARAFYGLGDVAAAKEWLAKALRAKGGTPYGAWSFRARMALDANELDAARAAIARTGEAGATARETALLDGEALMREGDFAGARRSLDGERSRGRRAGRIDPQKEYLLARIDAAAGDYRAAARRLRGVKPFIAGEPGVGIVLGLVLEGSGDIAQAETVLRRGLASAPDEPIRLDALAAFLIRAGRFDEAFAIVDRLLVRAPGAGVQRCLAILLARGDSDRAVAVAKEHASTLSPLTAAAAAFGPKSAAARNEARALDLPRGLMKGASVAGSNPAAIRDAAKVTSSFGESAAARLLAGELFLIAGEDAQARIEFDRALTLAPRSTSALVGRLRVDVRGADLDAAEARLFAIVMEDAGNATARVALARILSARGRFSEAAALLRPTAASLATTPRDAALYATLLRSIGASSELGAFAEAVRRARPFDPDTAELLAATGRLDEASLAARDALLREPFNRIRAQNYAALMNKRGRDRESAALLAALALRNEYRADGMEPPAGGDVVWRDDVDPPPPGTLNEARAAYFAASTDPLPAFRFGMALRRAGALEEASRVEREAIFWSLGGEAPLSETDRS